jgi:dsDNA-specific endonuclease/ATPase MutS2
MAFMNSFCRFIEWLRQRFSIDEPLERSEEEGLEFESVTLEITRSIDLHTFQPRDIRRVVEEYLTQARQKGFSQVRIIHGKGKGVQKRVVHELLLKTPFVLNWHDAPPESGGWGATIAHLAPVPPSGETDD